MYCRGNPIKYSDPSGYDVYPPGWDITDNTFKPPYTKADEREALEQLKSTVEFIVPPGTTLIDEPIEIHHLYPRKFKGQYPKGIDIEAPENKVELSKSKHRLKTGPEAPGIHTGPDNYSKNVRDYIKNNPNATKEAWEGFIKLLRVKFHI